jgi:hypothetical protein
MTIAPTLDTIIDDYFHQLNNLPDANSSYKPSPAKWSKKEIIGHLIDSAQANIRRFITAQYEENPSIAYDQDKWVTINNYQHLPLQHVIQLWYLLNKQVVYILQNTSDETGQRTTSKTNETHTVEWLAEDYIKHLKHHIHQVLNLEPVAYP